MSNTASVIVRDSRFPAGASVGLYERHAGFVFNPGAERIKTAKVRSSGEIVFENLPDGGRYFVAAVVDGQTVQTSVTAKVQEAPRKRLSQREAREQLAGTVFQTDDKTQVAGARNAKNARSVGRQGQPFAAKNAGVATPPSERPLEANPSRRIEDAGSREKLRSATITGSAEPVAKDEHSPDMKQEDVPEGTPQRSATAHGTAQIIPPGEVSPAQPQEESAKGLRQRSDTPHGQVEALPPAAQPSKPKRAKRSKKAPAARRTNRTKAQDRSAGKRRTRARGRREK